MKTTLQNVVKVLAQKSEHVQSFKNSLCEYGISREVFAELGFTHAIEYSANEIERVELFPTIESAKEALVDSLDTFEMFNDIDKTFVRDDGLLATSHDRDCNLIMSIVALDNF